MREALDHLPGQIETTFQTHLDNDDLDDEDLSRRDSGDAAGGHLGMTVSPRARIYCSKDDDGERTPGGLRQTSREGDDMSYSSRSTINIDQLEADISSRDSPSSR